MGKIWTGALRKGVLTGLKAISNIYQDDTDRPESSSD